MCIFFITPFVFETNGHYLWLINKNMACSLSIQEHNQGLAVQNQLGCLFVKVTTFSDLMSAETLPVFADKYELFALQKFLIFLEKITVNCVL